MSKSRQHETVRCPSLETQTEPDEFFQSAIDLLCTFSLDGYFQRLNPAVERVLGYAIAELVATPVVDLVHPEDRAATLAELDKLAAGIPSVQFENRCRCRDGSYRCLEWTSTPLLAKGIVHAVVRDVTEIGSKQIQRTLQETQERYELVAEISNDGIWDWHLQTGKAYYSPRWQQTLGFEVGEISDRDSEWFDRIHPEDTEQARAALKAYLDGATPTYELEHRLRHKDGSYRWIVSRGVGLHDNSGQPYRMIGSNRDITERKQAEESLRQYTKALQEAHQRLMFHVENSPLAMAEWDSEFRVQYWSQRAEAIFGWQAQEVIGKRPDEWRFIHEEDADFVNCFIAQLLDGRKSQDICQNRNYTKDGSVIHCEWNCSVLRDEAGNLISFLTLVQDVTDRKQTEAALQENAEMLHHFLAHTPASVAMFDREMRYRLVSRRWLEEYDLGNRDIIGKSHYEIFPDIPQRWQEIHQRCLQGAVESCEEDPFVRADGRQEWIRWKINPWKGDRGEISGIIMDTNVITERKQAKEELQRLNEELSRSNRDLEMFAYVASHDLQEPLRAVNSYTQLLARKYQSHLDAKADKYIGYIVEGATRMQQLINDLLEFSRVGTRGKELVPTNCEVILKQVLANLRVAIAESHATITHTPLPTVLGDEIQLIQLLQNLIGNAIKFRREEPPHIHISAARQEKEWLFSVRDNGIGLEPEYFDRIFTIFQRLHSRSEYSGTGIGLAVCKKIVERHGGRIWVESELGVGTTFYFTLNEEFCDRERSCQTC
jgi:PAS domain S-box-containing protein